jgi:hypothetical protein
MQESTEVAMIVSCPRCGKANLFQGTQPCRLCYYCGYQIERPSRVPIFGEEWTCAKCGAKKVPPPLPFYLNVEGMMHPHCRECWLADEEGGEERGKHEGRAR